TLKMLDLICPKEKPCDSVPEKRPVASPASAEPPQKQATP
ncbi:trehalase, partial [Citrobacter farmeri]